MSKFRDSHQRALNSSLYVIEENLQRVIALLKNDKNEQTITYKRINTLDSTLKVKMLKVIADMLNEIAQMKELFEVETEKINLKAEISAALDEIWIILVDLEPERFEAYGDLSEPEKALIEPHIKSLQSSLDQLNQLLHPKKPTVSY